ERAAGTPWRAAESLEVMAILDTPAWACLCGLLSECPVAPDALGAILDGRASAVSATAFACFTTRAQLDRVREFGRRLRDLLRQCRPPRASTIQQAAMKRTSSLWT